SLHRPTHPRNRANPAAAVHTTAYIRPCTIPGSALTWAADSGCLVPSTIVALYVVTLPDVLPTLPSDHSPVADHGEPAAATITTTITARIPTVAPLLDAYLCAYW
ncbi:unnamed protein product, partial [Scytosiphon promiscuus]